MKPSILVPVVFVLVVVISPALAASGKAKDEARRGCKRNFGGTSELVRVDKDSGFAYCRTGRRTEKFPFRWTSAKKVKPPQETLRTFGPAAKAPAEPVACQDCDRKPEQQPTLPPGKVNLPPTEVATPQESVPAPPVVQPELPTAKVPTAQPGLTSTETAVITRPTREQLMVRYGRDLFEQAERICLKQNGAGATVDFIDEKNWKVVCRGP